MVVPFSCTSRAPALTGTGGQATTGGQAATALVSVNIFDIEMNDRLHLVSSPSRLRCVGLGGESMPSALTVGMCVWHTSDLAHVQ